MSSASMKSGAGSERSLRTVMPSPNASITAATPRDRSTSTHDTDHIHLSSPSKGGGVVGVVRLPQTVPAPHTHVHTRTASVSSGSLDGEVDTQRREAQILATAAIEAALRAVLGDDEGSEQGGLSSSSRIIPRLSIKRDVYRDGGGLGGIGSSRESLSGLLEMGSASVSSRNVSALAMSTSRSTYVGPPSSTALGSSRALELIPEIITTTDPSVVVRANSHHSALEIPDVPIPDVSVSTTTSPTPSPAHDHSAPPAPSPSVQVASPYSLLTTSTGGGGGSGVISPVEAMVRRQSRDKNTNKKVNPKVRKSSVSALLERGVSVQELIDQYAADADRNKELWRERATLARLRADESRLVRERAAAKRDLSPRPAAASSPIGSPRKNNKNNAGGIVSYPSMWGNPVEEVKYTNTKGPGGDVPLGEEDSSDDDDEYHINEYRIDEPGVTPEDDQSIGILKRAKEADHRMKREEEGRRAAVLAERKAQVRESKYTPSSQFGGVTGSTPLVPLNGQDLHKRVLKDLPLTSDQLRELQRERKRIAKEYADTNRALAEAKHAKKRAHSQLDNNSSSTAGPSVVVHVVGGALVRDTPRRAPPLDAVTTRGNDNMRSVAQEQRDRRERLAKQQQQQQRHLEGDSGVGGGDSSSSTSITAPVVLPLDDVDYDALRQRRKILDIGGGYLQEQRDAFTQRKLRMVERSRVQQEQADEIERTANELKELRKVGHRLHAKELYGRQGKKAPFYSKLARETKKSNSDQQQQPTMLLVPAKKQTTGIVDGGPTPTSGSSSLPVVAILPPIKRSTPNTSSSSDDLLVKSAQAKIRMLQLLQQESSSPSSSLA